MKLRFAIPLLLASLALLALAEQDQNPPTSEPTPETSSSQCRVSPSAQHGYCGMPKQLSNFQSRFQCDPEVMVGRPRDIDELRDIVLSYPRVKGAGNGHSFNKEMLCAGNDSSSVNILTTEMANTVDMIMAPVDPARWKSSPVPPEFPIQVNEDANTVTVAAGIPQRILLEYLSEYKYWKQPKGWTLPAFSWFIDQTIAGAVSTGTHGSSLRWGSLSSQMLSAKIMLANGTIIEVSPEINQHLWRAAGVSVGQLGIILEVTMRIRPQLAVEKKSSEKSFKDFVDELQSVQDNYNTAKASGNAAAVQEALFPLDETEAFWFIPTGDLWKIEFNHLEHTPLFVKENLAPIEMPMVQSMSGPGVNGTAVYPQAASNKLQPMPDMATGDAKGWSRFFKMVLEEYRTGGTFDSRKAYLSMIDTAMAMHAGFAPYNQYEVAFPISRAGTCMAKVGERLYGPENLSEGFRTPGLIRFTPGETYYLSNAQEGATMWINLEDYVSPSSDTPNEAFINVIRAFIDECGARLHWGKFQDQLFSAGIIYSRCKAGWVQADACFDGAKTYENWCSFGCAAHELDPAGKFRGSSDVWKWHAQRDGADVDFGSCCTPQGFNAQCTCASAPACAKN